MLQNAMTLEQQNEVSKKNWESMSYATLYESMSNVCQIKNSNESINYEPIVY